MRYEDGDDVADIGTRCGKDGCDRKARVDINLPRKSMFLCLDHAYAWFAGQEHEEIAMLHNASTHVAIMGKNTGYVGE